MTIRSGFFNSVNGDRKYDAAWFALFFGSLIANGIFPNPSNNLQVVSNTNMTTVVKAGKGWINGYFLVNDSDYVLQHDNADGVLKRIDRIVMRLNYVTRQIEIAIKKGTYASTPTAPTLKRDADAYELALADVLINNGATAITQANITDQRLNTTLCGIVAGVVQQLDTTTLFNQYQDWFDTWSVQQQQEFESWLATIQDVLSGDVAGNLQIQIDTLNNEINSHFNLDGSMTDKGHVQLQTTIDDSETKAATPKAVRLATEQLTYKTYRSGKDTNGIYTTVEKKRNDGTLAEKSQLSGGTSPNYTTRTITYYGLNGTTIEKTVTRTLSYDGDGDLLSEV